jgi:hypothetical protein
VSNSQKSSVDALIIIINDDFVKTPIFSETVKFVQQFNVKIIFVHHVDTKFPSYTTIQSLPPKVRELFNTIAVPYFPDDASYIGSTWTKILRKIKGEVEVITLHFLAKILSLLLKLIGF